MTTSFPADKYNALIEALQAKTYGDPNECLAQLEAVNKMFRKVLDQNIILSKLPQDKRILLHVLAEICAPIIDYTVVETYRFLPQRLASGRTDYIVPVYMLRLRSSALDLENQAESFYAKAVESLSNPMLKNGVSLKYILTQLVDRYSQEAGVDDPDEIERIVGSLVSRFFTDATEAEAPQPGATVIGSAQPVQPKDEYANFADAMAFVKSRREIVPKRIAYIELCNTPAFIALSRWVAPPAVEISVQAMPICPPEMDDEARKVVISYPEMRYEVYADATALELNLRKFTRFCRKSQDRSLLRTSLTAIKDGLNAIPQLPPQNISISLRKVIEDNFNVTLIEIDNEADRYATPEYFEATRSNVDRVVTTLPAIVDREGKIIQKGLYLVPMKNTAI